MPVNTCQILLITERDTLTKTERTDSKTPHLETTIYSKDLQPHSLLEVRHATLQTLT